MRLKKATEICSRVIVVIAYRRCCYVFQEGEVLRRWRRGARHISKSKLRLANIKYAVWAGWEGIRPRRTPHSSSPLPDLHELLGRASPWPWRCESRLGRASYSLKGSNFPSRHDASITMASTPSPRSPPTSTASSAATAFSDAIFRQYMAAFSLTVTNG